MTFGEVETRSKTDVLVQPRRLVGTRRGGRQVLHQKGAESGVERIGTHKLVNARFWP